MIIERKEICLNFIKERGYYYVKLKDGGDNLSVEPEHEGYFYKSFKEASAIISDSRDECEVVPDSFEKQFKRVLINNKYTYTLDVPDSSLYIMVIQDHTDDGEGDYTVYADMSIKNITFIDENMNIFNVDF